MTDSRHRAGEGDLSSARRYARATELSM